MLGNLIWLCVGCERLAKGVLEVSVNSWRSLLTLIAADWNLELRGIVEDKFWPHVMDNRLSGWSLFGWGV